MADADAAEGRGTMGAAKETMAARSLVGSLRSELRHALSLRQPKEALEGPAVVATLPSEDPRPMVAIDGSFSFLWSMSDLWVAAVRVAALEYRTDGEGFHKVDLQFHDRALSVSTNGQTVARMDDLHRDLYMATEGSKEQHKDMVNEFRRRLEGQVALHIARERKGRLIALDGSLSSFPRQADYLGLLVEASEAGHHMLVGVSKDSMTHAFRRILTDEEFLGKVNGVGFVRVPPDFEQRQSGLLRGDVYFARLHPQTPKWFRVDLGTFREEPQEVFSHLAAFSSSALCPGYPYPLLEAHRAAVTIRQFRQQLEDLCLKEAIAQGMTWDEALRGLVDMDGKRLGAFHEYLDKMAKELK